jgi:hypothetical protein
MMLQLRIGQSRAISVDARSIWNATGISVRPGEKYLLEASGTWFDWGFASGPDGFNSNDVPLVTRWLLRMTERLRRVPNAKWFCLSGAINQAEDGCFAIGGILGNWEPLTSGELFCFANDVKQAYWNNEGKITITVKRLS